MLAQISGKGAAPAALEQRRRRAGDTPQGTHRSRSPLARIAAGRPSRVLAFFAVCALAPLVLLAYLTVAVASRSTTSEAEARLQGVSSLGSAYIQLLMNDLSTLVSSYARGPALTTAVADGDYTNYQVPIIIQRLTDLQSAAPGVLTTSLVDPSGHLRAIVPATPSPSLVGVDFSYRDWYVGVMRTRHTYVSEGFATGLAGQPLEVVVVSPIFGVGQQILGLILASYKLDTLQALVSKLAASQRVAMTVTDQRGTIIAGPGGAPTRLVSSVDEGGVVDALAGLSSVRQVTEGGAQYMRAYSPVPVIGWTISATLPLSVALVGVDQLRSVVFPIAGLAIVILVGLAYLGIQLGHRRVVEEALVAAEGLAREARAEARSHAELSRAKDDLMSTVSHELRTPLASLVGFAELLVSRDYTPAKRKEFLTVMVQEGRRLTTLINDFLDLERMGSGLGGLVVAPLDMATLLDRAKEAAGEKADAPIKLNVPDNVPLVMADRDSILQVLANVLSNARKYSPHGGKILVGVRVLGEAVEVSVQDSGLGIPAEELPRMFQKFHRIDRPDHRNITGTGLGLAISQRLIEGQGGRMTVESDGPNMGTCVRFTIPIARDNAKEGDVLVVEDDPGFARLLEAEFAVQGLSSVWAADAETAEQLMKQMDARAIVLDLGLPGMPGEQFLARVRATRGTGMPVVVVTVKSLSTSDMGALHSAGVTAVLAKHSGGARAAAALVTQVIRANRIAS